MFAARESDAAVRGRTAFDRGGPLSIGWAVDHPRASFQYPLPDLPARALRAVVVDDTDDLLVIAVPDPAQPGLAESMASLARRPVRLIAAGADEIAVALAISRGTPSSAAPRRARLQAIVGDLGLGCRLGADARGLLAAAEEPIKDITPALLAHLTADWGIELLGLLDGLPHLNAVQMTFRPVLRVLLPPSLRVPGADPLIVPWCIEGETLLVACSTLPREDQLAAIVHWTGMSVRCVLCARPVLHEAAVAPMVSTPPASHTLILTPPDPDPAWLAGLDAAQRRQVQAIARQLGDREADVALRVFDSPAHAASTVPLPPPHADALALLPAQLARSLDVLPLALTTAYLEIALAADAPDEPAVAATVAIVTGTSVRVRRAGRTALAAAITHAYPLAARISTARLVTELSALVETLDGQPGPPATEALAALHGLPVIRLEHYLTSRDVVSLLPLRLLRARNAIPLRREGQVLWVAMTRPDEVLVAELARLSGLAVRPLLAQGDAIAARLAVLPADPHGTAYLRSWLDHPVVQRALEQNLLTYTQLLSLPETGQQPLDALLDAHGYLPAAQFAALAAALSELQFVDLHMFPYVQESVAAQGGRTRDMRWDAPADPTIVALLPPETIRNLGILPLRRDEDGLVVAVVDPFAQVDSSAVQALADEHPRVVVATRPAILRALTRIHGGVALGEYLLAHGAVSVDELRRALELHHHTGVPVGQALLSLNLVSEDQLAASLAEQQNLYYFSLQGMQPDRDLARLLPEKLARRFRALPLYETDQTLVVATPDPLNAQMLGLVAARTGRAVTPVVCTDRDLEALLEALYGDEYLQQSSSDLRVRMPDDSASRVLTRAQALVLFPALLLLCALLWRLPVVAGIAATAAASVVYLLFSLYRCYLVYRALSHAREIAVSAEEVAGLNEATLPVYTILVPLYREAAVLPTLLLGLSRLNYPTTKLDVKLLLEEDDTETLAAVEAAVLPFYVRPVIVPVGLPRGKPKACNYGLLHARGEYVVIYDAEDVPDPDQLKKVVLAFRKTDPNVACLQAKLNYFNSRQNLLTRWFTAEYSMWFDLLLPGLDAARMPVPLGGTSNHFIADRLRGVGAWDPYNVTEDADLGIRLYRRGWRTAMIDSTTYEEATSDLYNWLRQRSRWVKGYMQTYLVHMRHPVRLWRTLGPWAFFSFTLLMAGTAFTLLVNPIFWLLTTFWYLTHAGFIHAVYPGAVFYPSAISLFIGNVAFIYLGVAGCLRRGHFDLVKYALISPLYWALMSLAAWRGLLQLWTNPFHWEKTIHGLYRRR